MTKGIVTGLHPKLLVLVLCSALAACGGSDTTQATRALDPEVALRDNTAALQKTILEGAIAGAGSGAPIGFAIGGREGARRGAQAGSLIGLTAGSYVAFVQRRFILKESRLNRVLEDLQNNNRLLTATVASMQAVVAKSQAELAAAQIAGPEDLARETAEAQANFSQMQAAISRAEARQAEFAPVRSLNLAASDGRSPDPGLQILADRIAQMRDVAAQMQGLL